MCSDVKLHLIRALRVSLNHAMHSIAFELALTAISIALRASKQGAGRVIAIALLWLVAFHVAPASAATRLEIDSAARGIRIEVDDDAPPIIELKSDDLLPIRWERNGLRKAVLPAVLVRDSKDLVIVDDAAVSHALTYDGYLERVRIMPDFRAVVGDWHGQPTARERRFILWTAILFSLGLLLVMLIRKRTIAIVTVYCAAWMIAVAIHQSNRPQIVTRDELESPLFVPNFARSDQALRVRIAERVRWIPVVESFDHLNSLNARVDVVGEQPSIVIDLKRNTIVGLMRDIRR